MDNEGCPGGDRGIFLEAVSGARPLAPRNVALAPSRKPLPFPRSRWLDERQVLEESLMPACWSDEGEAGEEWAQNGISRQVLRDLRKGRWIIEREADLHGLDRDGARETLRRFLASCLRSGVRCVRVVHGKGLRSPEGKGVLKKCVAYWLSQSHCVLAFSQARPQDGGSGAVVVLLRQHR